MQRFWALLLLVLITPFLLLVSFAIALISGVPIIFTQERIGINKQPFVIYKFRTMRQGQITFLGKILRKTGIDELPQLVNIIEGKMNFAGPRPLTKEDILRLGWDTPEFSHRWSVKPGITGLAQLNNVCDAKISWAKDQEYLADRSKLGDLKIIAKSAIIPFTGKRKNTSQNSNL